MTTVRQSNGKWQARITLKSHRPISKTFKKYMQVLGYQNLSRFKQIAM